MVVLYKAWRISGCFGHWFLVVLRFSFSLNKLINWWPKKEFRLQWIQKLVAPFQQMKPGEFAHARIKSLNSYNPKSLETKPVSWKCPRCSFLWNEMRRTKFFRDFAEWKILSFILIHVKCAKWKSTAHYLRLAGISSWCCGRENFLNQSLRLCISFFLSPQLSLCCQAVNTLVMCPHFSEWRILPLSMIPH